MKIVVVDSWPMNPDDLDWSPLRQLGSCDIYADTQPGLVVERCRSADAVLTNRVRLGDAEMARLPGLRYIGVTATGTNSVDLPAAKARGIAVTNVPAYSTDSVAQCLFAHILEFFSRTAELDASVRRQSWLSHASGAKSAPFPEALAGKTIGIIGYGAIGRQTAKIASAFGMRIIVHSRTRPEILPGELHWTTLEGLLREADVIALCCPLTEQTARLINRERLALMKPSAFLVNTARGGLIDEAALAQALNSGRLAGAGVDVLDGEPPRPNHPLLEARNCTITPHTAWATRDARERLLATVIGNLRGWLAGTPRNVVV
jgi:glycerate dehydrogenase